MKILFLSRRFYPDTGGVEKHVFEISRILVKKGHEVTVVTESRGHSNKLSGINIIRIEKLPDSWFKKFYLWKWMIGNISLFKSSDLIHAHDVYFWYLPIAILLPLKKSFVTFHGYETYPITKKAIIVRKISEFFAKGNICVGEFMKKWYFANPDKIIYGGVEPAHRLVSPKSAASAVFIGRLDTHTGVLDYAQAVEKIRKKYPEFKFSILGDGIYFGKLRKYIPLGFKKDADRYLREANFAFVSRYLSILEAFANRRLVLAHFDNEIKEDYLKMTPFKSFMIISSSSDEISKKTEYFLENPKEATKITEKAYEWVKDKTWESVAKSYLNLWREK